MLNSANSPKFHHLYVFMQRVFFLIKVYDGHKLGKLSAFPQMNVSTLQTKALLSQQRNPAYAKIVELKKDC